MILWVLKTNLSLVTYPFSHGTMFSKSKLVTDCFSLVTCHLSFVIKGLFKYYVITYRGEEEAAKVLQNYIGEGSGALNYYITLVNSSEKFVYPSKEFLHM